MAKKAAGEKVAVSTRALEQRVARALAKKGKTLRKCRVDSPRYRDLGGYYVIDASNNVSMKRCDIDGLAKLLGVLRPHEITVGEKIMRDPDERDDVATEDEIRDLMRRARNGSAEAEERLIRIMATTLRQIANAPPWA